MRLILATCKNGEIGSRGGMCHESQHDMSHFYTETKNNIVIMGSSTFKSMNREPLKDRINIVITTNTDRGSSYGDKLNNTLYFLSPKKSDTIHKICSIMEDNAEKEVFVIGGMQTILYLQEFITSIDLTRFDLTPEHADVRFDIKRLDNLYLPTDIFVDYTRAKTMDEKYTSITKYKRYNYEITDDATIRFSEEIKILLNEFRMNINKTILSETPVLQLDALSYNFANFLEELVSHFNQCNNEIMKVVFEHMPPEKIKTMGLFHDRLRLLKNAYQLSLTYCVEYLDYVFPDSINGENAFTILCKNCRRQISMINYTKEKFMKDIFYDGNVEEEIEKISKLYTEIK